MISPQSHRRFQKEGPVVSEIVGDTPWTLLGSPKRILKNGCRRTAGTNADFRSMSCWASSLISRSTLSICTRKGEWSCPSCSQTRPVVAMTTLALGIAAAQLCAARSYGVRAVLASASSLPTGRTKSCACSASRSREVRGLVIARAGFLCEQPQPLSSCDGNRQQKCKRSGLASAKTPATACVERPVCKAEAQAQWT